MSDDSSQVLLARFRDGESHAAVEVFDRYVGRLIGLVRRRMSPALQRRVDPEDVVQSALRSFFVRAAGEEYVLERAGDLWRLLAAIALNKLRRQVEVHTAAKRNVAKEQTPSGNFAGWAFVADREPAPGEETALLEEVEHVMRECSPLERQALQLRLSGETIEQIASTLDRSQRSVRRWLQASREALEQRLLREESGSGHGG